MKLYHFLRQIWTWLPPHTWWGIYSTLFAMLVLFLLLAFLAQYLKGTLP